MGNQFGNEATRLCEINQQSRIRLTQPMRDAVDAKLADRTLDRAAEALNPVVDVTLPLSEAECRAMRRVYKPHSYHVHRGIYMQMTNFAPCVLRMHGWTPKLSQGIQVEPPVLEG